MSEPDVDRSLIDVSGAGLLELLAGAHDPDSPIAQAIRDCLAQLERDAGAISGWSSLEPGVNGPSAVSDVE